jgi:hypothetical protein
VLAGVRRDVDAESLRTDGIEAHILDITVDTDVAALADRVARDPLRRPVRALMPQHRRVTEDAREMRPQRLDVDQRFVDVEDDGRGG